ncbi:MAG: pyrroline-5-carboxylate reductase [Candidatus Schekmanbacteria bacterium]|nr:pyrroline-5-carboxylate reductase [Candidatus Schekmanbacteria bacterium]
MLTTKRIAILGTGNMGGALLGGILKAGLTPKDNLIATVRREKSLARLEQRFPIAVTTDNTKAVRGADIVILCVKPQAATAVLSEIRGCVTDQQLFISILAGVTTSAIAGMLGCQCPVVRAMPNIAALVDESATAIYPGELADSSHVAMARAIFEAVGGVEVVDDENLMNTVTGLSGSGPAYIYMVIEALTDGGVKMGLSRPISLRLATQAVLGAARLVQETGEHPAVLRDQVTTPGGTAIAAIHELERHGLRPMLISAVVTATERSEQLSRMLVAPASNTEKRG